MINEIFYRNNLVQFPKTSGKTSTQYLGTVISNLSYFGHALSKEALSALSKLGNDGVRQWWAEFEPMIKEVSGESRKMAKFVVYKNFPTECLEKTDAEYWVAQICMYLGVPNEYFTQEEKDRPAKLESFPLKVLHLGNENSLQTILNSLLSAPARWVSDQERFAKYFVLSLRLKFDPSTIVFKENLVKVVQWCIEFGVKVHLKSATDVLRLTVGMSGGDVSFKTPSKFRNFTRRERRFILNLLEDSSNLEEDVARDREVWKKLLRNLHANEYGKQYGNVCLVQDALYNDNVKTFNSGIEQGLLYADPAVLNKLQTRPGEFMRRFHNVVNIFGHEGAVAFSKTFNKLSVFQLLKTEKYLESFETRKQLTIAPKGNWTKLKVVDNEKLPIQPKTRNFLSRKLSEAINKKLAKNGIKTINLNESAAKVKLQTNDSELTPFGRGTTFNIPENVKFIRTASYWQAKAEGYYNIWFDNGLNFFDGDWNPKGTISWDQTVYPTDSYSPLSYYVSSKNNRNLDRKNSAAIFSGDPCNSKEMKGRACQMIDLYPEKLKALGVRYAVWNILCYSRIPFNKATDVFAAFQWGEEATDGKLFELSRCQLAFPVTGETFSKYIAYIDLVENKIVYLDANFKANVSSAALNEKAVSSVMPAYIEYLNTLPSVYDLFKNVKKSKTGPFVGFDDEKVTIKSKKAYVFKPLNKSNSYQPLEIQPLLK